MSLSAVRRCVRVVVTVTLLAGAAAAAADGPSTIQVLDNDSWLRAYFVHRSPVTVDAAGQISKLTLTAGKTSTPVEFESVPPPAEWFGPTFDDSTWQRTRSPVEPYQPDSYTYGTLVSWHAAVGTSAICLRGRFVVEDLANVTDARLSLEYVGGVVVLVNGREVARGHLPAGPLAADTLAERYPDDLYCTPEGGYLQDIKKDPDGFARRYRKLDIPIPADALVAGVNVLALEIRRSPINELSTKAKRSAVGGMSVVPGLWAYAELKSLSLTASGAIVANVARPADVQVWTPMPYDTVTVFDSGEPGQPAPVHIAASPNGVFSGRLAVGSSMPIRGLKVTVGELSSASGKIPASAVQVRYAEPALPGKSRVPAHRFNALLETIPAEIPVAKVALPRESYLRNGASEGLPIVRKSVTPGAVAPIWITVRVPADTKPGRYEALATVSAEGLAAMAVPIRLDVAGWPVPSPSDFRITNFGFNSPESLARHYGVPLWSDRHFEMIGKSLALAAEIGSRHVIADLTVDFYGVGGNVETLVRWIAQPDGSYKHDFTVLDKYLDVVARSVGKPQPLRLNCWGEDRPGWKTDNSGRRVSRLDPATGKVEPMDQPELGSPENLAFWKPVLQEVRKRIEARGWLDVTSFGHNSYNSPPNPKIVDVCRQLWPDGVWSYTAHNGLLKMNFATLDKAVTMPARYSECVWTRGNLSRRGYSELFKPRPSFWCWGYRGVLREWSPLALLRQAPEGAIMRGHDGIGQLGIDIFPFAGTGGRPAYLNTERGGLGPSNSTLAMLAPGTDGPVPTERFEMFREGMQLAEAVLFVYAALESKKLTGELAERAVRCLDQRADAVIWQWSAGSAARDAELLSLAGEIAAALAAK